MPIAIPSRCLVLDDLKGRIVVDDGRRWLNRNPERKFDLIVQNTTWHWRSEVTNLLSADYFELCRQHLNPGGVMYLNATQSTDIPYTVAHAFKHVISVGNFVAGSDHPFDLRPDEISKNLMKFVNGGHPTFTSSDPNQQKRLDDKRSRLANTPMTDMAPGLLQRTDLWLITDDNMATEFKRSRDDQSSGADRSLWWDENRAWKVVFHRKQ